MITANFIHRVFRIKCGDSVGTGFTIDVDNKQYLVTAKHVVQGFSQNHGIEIFGNNSWLLVPMKGVSHCPGNVDISVFSPSDPISPPNLPVSIGSDGLEYGQDVFFMGFPYGVLSQVIFGDDGYPLPLVKRLLRASP